MFDYKLIRRPRRRTIQLRVDVTNNLTVVAPAQITRSEVDRLIASKAEWIQDRLEFNRLNRPPRAPIEYRDGGTLEIEGRPTTIRVIPTRRGKAIRCGNELHIPIQGVKAKESTHIANSVERYLRELAKKRFHERAEYYASQLGVRFQKIRVRTMRSRWGSCSPDGSISYNLRLILAPPDYLDYVVVHELCHILHMNHSREFWKCVASVYPDYKRARKWLTTNGYQLEWN